MAKKPQAEKVKAYLVGETGIKIGRTVYAPGAEVPADLITDEIAPFLVEGVVDAKTEEVTEEVTDTPSETPVETQGE